MTTDAQWREMIQIQLESLQREVHELRAENTRLRERADAVSVPLDGPGVGPREQLAAPSLSRRGMFAAIAGAAGGLALAQVAQAAPAAAADGQPVLQGQSNGATSRTGLSVSDDFETTLYVANTYSGISRGATVLVADSWAREGSGVGMRGNSSGDSGRGVEGVNDSSTGYTVGVFGQVSSPSGWGVRGTALAGTGVYCCGVVGETASDEGMGVWGIGGRYGVHGMSDQTNGVGVRGSATSTTGGTIGVHGVSSSASGYGVYSSGRFRATGRSFLATPNSAPASSDLSNGSISLYLDQANNRLRVKVKYSTGVVKTGSIALA